MKYPITKLTFLILFLCVFFNCLYSQDRLAALDIVDQRAINLQEEDIIFIENLQNSPTVENISFVRVPDVVSIQQNGRLSLRFSYNGLTHDLGVFVLDVDYDSPEKYTWRGEIPEYNGVFAVIKNQIGYSGFLSIDNLHFEIYAIDSSHSLLVQKKVNSDGKSCGLAESTNRSESSTPSCESDGCAAIYFDSITFGCTPVVI